LIERDVYPCKRATSPWFAVHAAAQSVELPPPEQLEVHHVLEVAADDGTDDPVNLRAYCSACHAMVNWIRTYFGHYPATASFETDTTADL
jgi:hypothetical protein